MRKWRQFGLKNVSTKLILMVMSLPLVPHILFDESFMILQCTADVVSIDHPKVLEFMAYLRRTWQPISEKVSVYGCSVRTNNIVESFHNVISKKLCGPHPYVWIFIGWYYISILLNSTYRFLYFNISFSYHR